MAKLPGPSDIPRVGIQADPGVRIADTTGALSSVAEGVQVYAEGVERALVRQQKRQDAIALSEATLAFDQDSARELQAFQTEADPADLQALQTFQKSRRDAAQKFRDQYKDKVSEDAFVSLEIKLNQTAAATIGSAETLHIGAQQDKAMALLEERAGVLSRQAATYPEYLDVLVAEGDGALSDFAGILTPEQERKAADLFRKQMVGEGIRGWARSQSNPLTTVRRLTNGDLPDSIRPFWEAMDSDEREALRKQVVSETSELISLENRLSERQEKAQEEALGALHKRFYLTNDPQERETLYRSLTALETDPERIRKLQDYWNEGGTFGEDNAAALLQAEADIRGGVRTNPIELAEAYLGAGVSADTFRTRLLPMLEATQDKRFRRASDWLSTRLGIPPNTILGSGQEQAARRVSEAQAELLQFQQENPDGDYWAEAQAIAERTMKEAKPQDERLLRLLETRLNRAKKDGDVDEADRLQAQLEDIKALMGE